MIFFWTRETNILDIQACLTLKQLRQKKSLKISSLWGIDVPFLKIVNKLKSLGVL